MMINFVYPLTVTDGSKIYCVELLEGRKTSTIIHRSKRSCLIKVLVVQMTVNYPQILQFVSPYSL